MANDKDFVVAGAVEVGKDTKVTLGTVTDNVQQTSYDIASASYDNKSFNFSSQDSSPVDVAFKTDGTKLYVMGNSTDTIYQYALSTAWDVSTASYESKSLSVNTQETDAYSVVFNNDGTKVYTVGRDFDAVQEYNLSTAWDISTGSHSQSFSVSSQATDPRKVRFKSDGTKMYVFDASTDNVFQYSLSTAFDVSTSSYESKSFNFNTQDASPLGIGFNAEGTKMFSVGATNDSVYQYSLSTSWDVSTSSYDSVAFSVATQESAPSCVVFDTNGSKMFVVGTTTDTVHQYSTASYADQIDLATGNYFADTPTGASTYAISNAGDVQSFQLEVTGGTEEVAQNFSTTLYTGNAGTQTITNGIDLAGDGGLVWLKNREASSGDHWLFDTQRGAGYGLISHSTNAQTSFNNASLTSFNSNGFSVGDFAGVNTLNDFVSWTFKKEPSFFDVVTYTGTGSVQTIAHNLGTTVGSIIIKKTTGSAGWQVYHRSLGATKYMILDETSASYTSTTKFNDTEPTDTVFTVSTNADVNQSGQTYVAYLFAHDDAADGLIQCGSYTGTGSAGKAVTLGWEPQWLMIKRTDATGYSWEIMDTQRGFTSGNDKVLRANSSGAEITAYDYGTGTSTGFELTNDIAVNASGGNYIYVAIRAASDPDITWPSSIEWAGGSAPSSPATGETDVFTLSTDDGGTTYTGIKSIDNAS